MVERVPAPTGSCAVFIATAERGEGAGVCAGFGGGRAPGLLDAIPNARELIGKVRAARVGGVEVTLDREADCRRQQVVCQRVHKD